VTVCKKFDARFCSMAAKKLGYDLLGNLGFVREEFCPPTNVRATPHVTDHFWHGSFQSVNQSCRDGYGSFVKFRFYWNVNWNCNKQHDKPRPACFIDICWAYYKCCHLANTTEGQTHPHIIFYYISDLDFLTQFCLKFNGVIPGQ